MTNLSPAATIIALAFDDRYEICSMFNENWQEECLAAVLRAAADQVVPNGPKPSANSDYHLNNWYWLCHGLNCCMVGRYDACLLSDGNQPTHG
jgi:hypothetical protein